MTHSKAHVLERTGVTCRCEAHRREHEQVVATVLTIPWN